ncbi:MAG TPA: ABC transporter substrate-binding protein, partial [Euzebya sp.]|nr:ABC transporter substrate-binding protein [Euzebya sp.]
LLMMLLLALAMVATACGGSDTTGDSDADTATDAPAEADAVEEDAGEDETADGELTAVSLQLQWFTQGQFAGYFAAVDQGFYEEVGLDVTILEGGVDIVPQTVLDSGGADFAIAWVPKALVSIEEGADIVNIAQVFQRSGTLQVSFADAGLDDPADLEGQVVGNWGFGNEFELLAGLRQAGLDPDSDVTLAQQNFDMLALLSGEIDAAQAMTYNEYAQVLETVNPETGELFTPEDLTVIDWNDVGTAMLQDAVWADASRLEEDEAYRESAVAFVEASIRGWAYCRDNLDECTQIVLDNAPTLGESHQQWQVNETNKLIWPSPLGAGIMDPDLWAQTVEIATSEEIVAEEPGDDSFRTDIAEEAVANLTDAGVDVTGEDFEPAEVTLNEGGE